MAFSKEFLLVPGQEPGADGAPYGQIKKRFGFLISLTLSQYHVLWYGKVDPTASKTVSGTYEGDEDGVSAKLILKPDHTFEQTVSHLATSAQSKGTWTTNGNGGIVFSKEFLKASGQSLNESETATASDLQDSNLQIVIEVPTNSGPPTFKKKQFFWE